jgi:hypothetical protein
LISVALKCTGLLLILLTLVVQSGCVDVSVSQGFQSMPACARAGNNVPGPWIGDASTAMPLITAEEQQACQAVCGTIEQIGFDAYSCVYPASDAGKSCLDSAECEGLCMAADDVSAGTRTRGKCTQWVNANGTGNLVVDGRAQGFIIVD